MLNIDEYWETQIDDLWDKLTIWLIQILILFSEMYIDFSYCNEYDLS